MPALDMPRNLLERNGTISAELSQYEPSVAQGGPLLPTPTYMHVEGQGSGLEYGGQTYWTITTAELDSEGRVTREIVNGKGTKTPERTVITERQWDGADYEEVIQTVGGEAVQGYRRTLEEGVVEVKLDGKVYRVTRHQLEDGSEMLEATSDDGLRVKSAFDSQGRLLMQRVNRYGIQRPTINYLYDEFGELERELGPGIITSGGASQPDTLTTLYVREDEGRTIKVTSLYDPDKRRFTERDELRTYSVEGVLYERTTTSGYIDIGQISTKQEFDYTPAVPTTPSFR